MTKELQRWKNHQEENEASAGASYVCSYRIDDNKLIQQSKCLTNGYERVKMVSTRADGHVVLKI